MENKFANILRKFYVFKLLQKMNFPKHEFLKVENRSIVWDGQGTHLFITSTVTNDYSISTSTTALSKPSANS